MFDKLFRKTFVISNKKLNFETNCLCHNITYNNFRISTSSKIPNDVVNRNLSQIDFNKMEFVVTSELIDYGTTISNNKLNVTNNIMNTREIYYIYEPDRNIFILFNNLMLAKKILKSCNLPVEYNSERIFENGSYFRYIKLVGYSERLEVEIINNKIHFYKTRGPDILNETKINTYCTIEESEEKVFGKLYDAVKRLTQRHRNVSISLSGGVDSATVAYILTILNKNITAYSVGTEWGDEFETANKTAEYLGINLIKLYITGEEIVEEIPNVIAFYAFTEPVNIEISLVAQCVYKRIKRDNCQKEILFATGFGSDILNAGFYSPFSNYSELNEEIITTLKQSRLPNKTYSNIFSNNNSLFYNIRVVHPFWEPTVITESLAVPPMYKVVNGHNKYYFRKMMEKYLGHEIAWREKKAVHYGSGIASNLKRVLLGRYRSLRQKEYSAYYKALHKEIFYNNNFTVLSH